MSKAKPPRHHVVHILELHSADQREDVKLMVFHNFESITVQATGPRVVFAALGDIARAQGMTQIAKDIGLSRESLYKALSPEGNPELATVLKVLHSLGLRLQTKAIEPVSAPLPVKARPTAKT